MRVRAFERCRRVKPFDRRGFTLTELLAVIATTSVLGALCVGAVQKGMVCASKVREITAARNLVTALHSSAQDDDGFYLPGMDYRAGTSADPVYTPEGRTVTGHAAQRYPYRIRPYLGNEFNGTIFVNRNKQEIIRNSGGLGAMYDYQVSAYPALGMNIYCVGGVVRGDDSIVNEEDCIANAVTTNGAILAFASGGSGSGSSRRHGFSYVTPPTMSSGSPICYQWSSAAAWKESSDAMNYGWVDFRYDGRAVCAFLDGSVRLCSVNELSDMRLWNRNAQAANDPHYQMQ